MVSMRSTLQLLRNSHRGLSFAPRCMPTKPRLIIATFCVSIATVGCTADGDVSSAGECAAPVTRVNDTAVSAGQEVIGTATDLWVGCSDVITVYDDGSVSQEAMRLVQDAPVTFRQNGRTEELARVDAVGEVATAKTTVTVPNWAVPGEAQLQIGSAESATVRVSEDSS